MSINIADVDELAGFGGHNHRGGGILIQRDNFINQIGMVAFLEMEHIVRFIKDIERGEACTEETWNLSDANSGDTLDIEAVNLMRQRRYLLQ